MYQRNTTTTSTTTTATISEKSDKIESGFRRFLIAVAILRLFPTQLRSILVCCYYMIAFGALLILILYLNYFSTHQSHKFQAGLEQSFELASSASFMSTLDWTGSTIVSRFKRSSSESSVKTKTQALSRHKSNATRRRQPEEGAKGESRRAKPESAAHLPALSVRSATNSRFSSRLEPDRQVASESGWIPIVSERSLRAQTTRQANLGDSATVARPVEWRGNHRHHHYNQQQQQHRRRPAQHKPPVGYPNRAWRRPRLQGFNLRPSKMYKRVLLCDKTLVSLDYIKNLELEPRPFELSDHESNMIDLESQLELQRASNASSLQLAESMLDRHLSGPLLVDEDPLVKCDMWDLEKGLKNRKPPQMILEMAVKADFDTVRDAINRCRQLSEKTVAPEDEYRDGLEMISSDDLISLFAMKRGLIPGTKWCGLGDMASSYNDLGSKHRIDICCRAHDHCPIRLKPFRNDYGVLNIAFYTKSHCDCDADFYRCLREVHSKTADMLGNLYFNVMKLQCMREERVKVCREMKPIALGFERCVSYEESRMKTVFKFTTPPVAY